MLLSRRAERWRAGVSFWLRTGVAAVVAIAAASVVWGQPARELYLEVFINDQPTGLIGRFVQNADGTLSADAGELCRIGLKPARGGCRDGVDVPLIAAPDLTWVLDEPGQTLHVTAGAAHRAARVIDAQGPEEAEEDRERPVAGFGAVLNYDLGLDWEQNSGTATDPLASGVFEGRLYSPIGIFHHGEAVSDLSGDASVARRLETYWRSSWSGMALQMQLGDVITRGPGWSNSVRLGGVLVRRNFDLRPDLVTLALPSYSGSAAVPSTVDVYADSLRRYTTEVPAGPFLLTDLPIATGTGDARIIVRDASGRETAVSMPFMVSPYLLRPGLVDYALAYGRPRLGIGTQDDHYGEDSFGSASLRFGVTSRLTLSMHAEYGNDLQLVGGGATFAVGQLGTVELAMANSQSGKGDGNLAEVAGRFDLGRLAVSGRRLQMNGDFYDIARYSVDTSSLPTVSQTRNLSQLSLAIPLSGHGAGLNLFYADTERFDGDQETGLGASFSKTLRGGRTLNLTGIALDGNDGDEYALGVSLHVPLGRYRSAGGRIETRGGTPRQAAYLTRRAGHDAPDWDWRLQLANSDQTDLYASASRDFRYAGLDLAARLSGGDPSLGARANGALVLGGGGVFLSRWIDDSFAVVDAGAAGVEVRHENRVVGTTGRGGKLLVPDLRAWEGNQLSIDAGSLPLDATVESTRQVIRPAEQSGVRVDFGVDTSAETALVSLVGADGAPVPVGLTARLDATGGEFLVGYDGQLYLSGLTPGPNNGVTVHFLNNTSCHAVFPYTPTPGTITQIGGVSCL